MHLQQVLKNTLFGGEASSKQLEPATHVNDIPIDPALVEPAIDPAILAEEQGMGHAQVFDQNEAPPHIPFSPVSILQELQYTSEAPRQYSQGPQGDPFAPPPPAPYLAIEEETPLPIQKPVKKKRRGPKPGHCGSCEGTNMKNKDKQPEIMVTCIECNRSEHPSCLSTEIVGDIVRSYPWKCVECKTCEICLEKGDDARIMFCDHCDRGWHMGCLQPPLEEAPKGKWHCPMCPPLGPNGNHCEPAENAFIPGTSQQCSPPAINELPPEDCQQLRIRESSIASSSQSVLEPSISRKKSRGKFKGAVKSIITDESDAEMETPAPNQTKSARKAYKKKGRPPKQPPVLSSDNDSPSPLPQPKVKRLRVHSPVPPPLPRVRLRLPAQKGKGKEREEDEQKGMFDDILSPEERDTSKATVLSWDKQLFERSRQLAEEKLAPPPQRASLTECPDTPIPGPSRPLRSSTLLQSLQHGPSTPSGIPASPVPSTPGGSYSHVAPCLPLRIRTIRFGQYDIKTWYDAPFPEEYATIPDGRLWICEHCLKYMKSRFSAGRHRLKCKVRHPPGDEIYRDGKVSIFEVDGRKNKIYCQNLCLLSKMFLDHKSLFYDVEPFLFYVIAEAEDQGVQFVGYFSKEKRCPKDYNVSCIMTLPVRQRQGWGNLLIDFSYLLSKKEQRLGSPEKPLSALGALGYRNYWTLAVMRFLDIAPGNLRLEDISAATSMTIEDVCTTLQQQSMIIIREAAPPPIRPSPGQTIKFPKGRKNGIARRALQRTQTQDDDASKGPFVPPKHYQIKWDRERVSEYLRNWESKGYLKLKPEKLKWTPFLVARTPKTVAIEAVDTNSLVTTERLVEAKQHDAPTPADIISVSNSTDFVPPVLETTSASEAASTLFSPRSPATDERNGLQEKVPPAVESDASIPIATPGRRLRRQASDTKTPAHDGSTPVPAQPRNSRSRSSQLQADQTKADNTLADDEALALQLDMEERRSTRTLRSRQNSSQQLEQLNKKLSTPTPVRYTSPRKRRRIESPVEEELSSPALAPTPVMVNGNHVDPVPKNSEEAPDMQLGEAQTPSSPGVHRSFDPASADGLPTIYDLDVKVEDTGTPFTTVTRQSLPSDDTVVLPNMAEQRLNGKHHGLRASMEDFLSMNVSHGVSAERTKLEEHEGSDADADGEYEEDAEGEPDDELLQALDTNFSTVA